MKTVYKYIKFEIWGGEDLQKWECVNKKSGATLGYAEFYEPWRQWVMEFQPECVFNDSCLRDITHFLGQLNKEKNRGKNNQQ